IVNLGGSVRGDLPVRVGTSPSLATPLPLTPRASQAAFARVGPKSAPPCFLLPPTNVGAMLFAISTQVSRCLQPLAPIISRSAVPPVAVVGDSSGQEKYSASAGRSATSTKRGRN